MKNIEKLITYIKTHGKITRIYMNDNRISVDVVYPTKGTYEFYAIFFNLPNIILDMLYSKNLIKIQLAINLI